jgi:hypothetical protein
LFLLLELSSKPFRRSLHVFPLTGFLMKIPGLPPARIGLLAAGMFLLSSGVLHAADVGLQAVLGETGSWESNPLMLLHNATPLYGSITSPELIFTDKTPTIGLTADTVVNENLFSQSSFDSTDVHENVNFTDQAAPRWNLGMQGKVDYDTTRTSELGTFSLNQTTASVRHLGLLAAPQVSFSPTQVDKYTLAGSAAISRYDNSSFIDYELFSIDPSYSHNFDPLNAGIFGVQVQRYQTTSGPQTIVDAISPSVGWTTTLTPRMTARASVGPQFSRQYGSGTVSKPWSLSYNFAGDLSYKGIQDVTELSASRNQYPFGNGTEALATIFSAKETHAINANFSFNAGGAYQTDTYQTSSPFSLDTLLTGNTGLTYHATERIDVTAAYRYRYETFTSTSGAAQDHAVTLGIAYRPQGWSL